MKTVLPFFLILALLAISCGSESETSEQDTQFIKVLPVAFGEVIYPENIRFEFEEDGAGFSELARIRLHIEGIPAHENGEEFTLIGGGLNNTGFHGRTATGFEGDGYHFADPVDTPGNNPRRDEDYKADFTRAVAGGELWFDIYYAPSDINRWGDRYPEGSELALTLMRKGTGERLLYAVNNDYNWSVANVGAGNFLTIHLNAGWVVEGDEL